MAAILTAGEPHATVLSARVLGESGDDPDRYASGKARKNYAGTSRSAVGSRRTGTHGRAHTDGRNARGTNGPVRSNG